MAVINNIDYLKLVISIFLYATSPGIHQNHGTNNDSNSLSNSSTTNNTAQSSSTTPGSTVVSNPSTEINNVPPTATSSPPPTAEIYKICQDLHSTASNGIIQSSVDSTESETCLFAISAPDSQRIALSCKVVKLVHSTSSLVLFNGVDVIADPPVVNFMYTSKNNVMALRSTVAQGDQFVCSWTTIENELF